MRWSLWASKEGLLSHAFSQWLFLTEEEESTVDVQLSLTMRVKLLRLAVCRVWKLALLKYYLCELRL